MRSKPELRAPRSRPVGLILFRRIICVPEAGREDERDSPYPRVIPSRAEGEGSRHCSPASLREGHVVRSDGVVGRKLVGTGISSALRSGAAGRTG
jgi:hypothetical protein